ncbi:MAG: choice-of-anchor J domain-containing protein, partial [Bacteroidota bacterium]
TKTLLVVLIGLLVGVNASGQIKLQEGFEGGVIPDGWGVWNNAPFPIDSVSNWTVRDTGLTPPGLASATTRAHSGSKSVGVSWWSSIDTNGTTPTQSDAWLITKRVSNIANGHTLRFWVAGGSTSFADSLQIWISDQDSTPTTLLTGLQLGTIIWPVGSTYGQFVERTFDLSPAAGLDLFIGFRYYMNCAVDGFFVYLDDVSVEGASGINPLNQGIPEKFDLSQNYPNPFNPATTIKFDLPKESQVSLKVYNALGEEVSTLVSNNLVAGKYSVEWNAGDVASGVYFYRLITSEYVQTRKMMLTR